VGPAHFIPGARQGNGRRRRGSYEGQPAGVIRLSFVVLCLVKFFVFFNGQEMSRVVVAVRVRPLNKRGVLLSHALVCVHCLDIPTIP
jgi:hypothetical protein